MLMLADHQLMAFVATADAERALAFYKDVLGLTLESENPFALVFAAGGTTVRVQKVPGHKPQPFTVLGWCVDDVAAAVASLVARGARFARYEGMAQDANGVWTAPSGAKIAWFHDPDGNVLSLTEEPRGPDDSARCALGSSQHHD